MKPNFLQAILFCFLPLASYAQINDYYNGIDLDSSPEVLKTQLAELITNTHVYVPEYTPEIWEILKITDFDTDDNNQVDILMLYGFDDTDGDSQTDRTRDKDMNCNFVGSCSGFWNREHVYPRSLGTPDLGFDNAGADVHAIRATDADMNSSRSNRKFSSGTGFSHITAQGDWYPGDEWKGDVARMMMYMYLRYPTQAIANSVAVSSNDAHIDMPDIFLTWNAEDPVTAFETQRNDYLETIQGNRNPFIDNPYLATLIWGGMSAENLWENLNITETVAPTFSIFPNPSSGWINYSSQDTPLSITIYNLQGQMVATDNDLSDHKTNLPEKAGVYFIQFVFENGSSTQKVIKVNP